MAVLDEMQSYVVANSTVFKRASSTGSKVPIWLNGFYPTGPDTAVVMIDTGGAPPIHTMSTGPFIRRPSVQVISRSTAYVTARANAQVIWDLFDSTVNTPYPVAAGSTSTVTYLSARPNQDLIDMGIDGNDRHMVSCNYTVERLS